MSTVQGLNVVIDLSHFNTVTSFSDIKSAGVVGIIHKATEYTNWSDPTYASRKPQALAAGLWWGAYHFGTNADGALYEDDATYSATMPETGAPPGGGPIK